MVFTFLAAQGHEVGRCLLEDDQLDTVRGYLDQAQERGVEIVLPVDVVAATAFAAEPSTTWSPPTDPGRPARPRHRPALGGAVRRAPGRRAHGLLERPDGRVRDGALRHGTRAVAQALVDGEAFTVVGGGDSAAAVRTLGFDDDGFGHISTGGGASLEYLEGKTLPGLTVLED